jgi:hypothetical protein
MSEKQLKYILLSNLVVCRRIVDLLPNILVSTYRSSLVFSMCSVRISARTQAILTEIRRGFPQSFQVYSGLVPRLSHDRFLPNPLQFVSHHIIRRCFVLILTSSLNNAPPSPQKYGFVTCELGHEYLI